MFRFSIRDLLWLTLAVALSLGWFLREQQLGAQSDKATEEARRWSVAVHVLKRILAREGWALDVNAESSEITLSNNQKCIEEVYNGDGTKSSWVEHSK